MQTPYLKIKLLNSRAILPSKREEDAGFDLYTSAEEEFIILKPGDIQMMPTGIAIEIPQDWVFYIAERSSAGSKGIARRCGVIDSGYRGEIFIPINNTSSKTIILARNMEEKLDDFLNKNDLNKEQTIIYPLSKAIAQGILLYSPHVEVEEVGELGDSERGRGALGSTRK
ncbi:dUTP pyrophosphatase [Patescibacteria group bacterium]|nr:dUTP pyrophosphatase [Patescibacteria group bacterium]